MILNVEDKGYTNWILNYIPYLKYEYTPLYQAACIINGRKSKETNIFHVTP